MKYGATSARNEYLASQTRLCRRPPRGIGDRGSRGRCRVQFAKGDFSISLISSLRIQLFHLPVASPAKSPDFFPLLAPDPARSYADSYRAKQGACPRSLDVNATYRPAEHRPGTLTATRLRYYGLAEAPSPRPVSLFNAANILIRDTCSVIPSAERAGTSARIRKPRPGPRVRT